MFIVPNTSEFAGVIYGLHNGDGVIRYVGATTQTLNKRIAFHRNAVRFRVGPVYTWLAELGPENLQVVVLETFTDATLHLMDSREVYHIAQVRATNGDKCLNIRKGGGRVNSLKPVSKETVAKMSKAISKLYDGLTPEEAEAERTRLAEQGAWGQHIRWHVNRSVTSEKCGFCTEDAA